MAPGRMPAQVRVGGPPNAARGAAAMRVAALPHRHWHKQPVRVLHVLLATVAHLCNLGFLCAWRDVRQHRWCCSLARSRAVGASRSNASGFGLSGRCCACCCLRRLVCAVLWAACCTRRDGVTAFGRCCTHCGWRRCSRRLSHVLLRPSASTGHVVCFWPAAHLHGLLLAHR